MAKWEKLPNKEVSMILPCVKRRRKILHSPKTSDKVNIYNLKGPLQMVPTVVSESDPEKVAPF